ncbi:MAG: indolepyruvate ferredoxin oxidoreductase [Candidatus Eisenbacteria sp.]|nr:indolepyruvate ferredoxin oxidoreductase [Candidatus Eisenbacteria bacterium]
MPELPELLLRREAWSRLIMGNHALVRAMVESGVRVVTTYPGSPTPEIAAALTTIPADQRPYYFEYSTNEKVATEVAVGASLNGHLSTVFFKSVGLNVAADTLIQLSMMEMIGGLVIILGDDPGANSSQNEQDNRHFARMSYIPMLEPGTPREAYEMFCQAAELSRRYRSPVFLRLTTHVCHAKEVVTFGPSAPREPDWTPRFAAENGPYVPIAQTVFPLKRSALAQLEEFAREFAAAAFCAEFAPDGCQAIGGRRLGVIATGLPAMAVRENLVEAGQAVDLLKLGGTYPLPVERILAFLNAHDEVLLVEELDRVLETEIKALAWDRGVGCRLHARVDREDLMGELAPPRTWKLLGDAWPELFPAQAGPLGDVPDEADVANVAPRLPQLCPGCGHRSAFHAVRQAITDDTITVADIGCHSMGFMPPYNMGQVLLCMGHSTATASGLAIGNRQRKVIAFIGDSTLFHAGLPGLVNAAMQKHNIVLVLLENGTTAMTGHQPRPGSGEVGERIVLPEMLSALGVEFIRDGDAYNQAQLIANLKEAMEYPGFAVVIARHPCMLKFTREQRVKRADFHMPQVQVDQAVCEQLRTCVAEFACPSFVAHADGTVTVHGDLCIGDGSCMQTCSVGAIRRPPAQSGRGKR